MRPVLEHYEYQEFTLPDPSASDRALLHSLSRYFTVTPKGNGYRVRAKAVAGVLVLDCAELRIKPKIDMVSGEMLLHWLDYAANPRSSTTIAQHRRWDTTGMYFTDVVVAAFIDECHILLRNRLRKDYVRHESVDGVLRGRLDVVKQASRRYGMLDRLHVRTFDRRVEVWENEVCGSALRYASKHAETAALRREAGALAKQFPACPTEVARSTLQRARHHRMNVHYVAAHTWAALLLRCGGVQDLLVQDELPGESRLLDMNGLWEGVVRRMVDGVRHQPIHVSDRAVPFRPDAVARQRDGRLAVDAKYKAYDDRHVSREDVHQVMTYAVAYRAGGTLRAAIVHPSEDETSREQVTLDVGGQVLGVIDVVGVDVRVHPADNAVTLKGLLGIPPA